MILDTHLYAVADGDAAAVEVVTRAERPFVPVIVVAEFRFGIQQSRHRTSYDNWLRGWLSSVAILDVTEETSQSYAAIGLVLRKQGRPIPANDLWIATLCRQHSLPLMSRDTHFDQVPRIHRISW